MYSPGDILMVYPKNDRRLVSDMISQFSHIDKIQTVDIKCSSGHQSSVRCVNFEWLCHWYFDLNGVPRRQFFRLLNFYSCNDFEREKLLDFSLPENIEDFYSYCSRPKRNYCETLRDFPNSINNLGLKELVELIPRIKTREYSICSSYRKDSTKLSLIVAFVKYQTVIRQPRHGVCSNYLCHLNFSDQIYAKILKSTLIFPHRDIPCIMIATGTGCASFHAYIQSIMGNSSNPSHLVFLGFRNKEKDFLFKKDWEDFEKSKNIKMFTAFSRDQHQKIYVQDRITENGSLIWEYISKGAWIYLSGNAKRMPDDVYESIKNIVKLFGKLTEKIATKFMSDLEKLNRYQTETY
ncbi:hypothetical protein HZS_2754 [Henneguya salminicola]|nr:hypothetical protein HZS_2754 [Henneguya salminicola]